MSPVGPRPTGNTTVNGMGENISSHITLFADDCVVYRSIRVQPTVTFPIGGNVNVLQNYKKT